MDAIDHLVDHVAKKSRQLMLDTQALVEEFGQMRTSLRRLQTSNKKLQIALVEVLFHYANADAETKTLSSGGVLPLQIALKELGFPDPVKIQEVKDYVDRLGQHGVDVSR